ncbi:Transcriptional activator of maltose regulon, MalT [Rhodovulum sp. P5]|uniref:DUF2927 domain-containing protein n=1 Tax=Rhodovulum sp. P5 TaxID=1564506 RepID=UPI0009C1D1FF|nr:DUF2927 domain-containing protein [Rhodovulum sp. P5]ARE38918.1 Transcriptional activator of maltose regulon, MalT [Rhodovulum sp. P5]
MRRGIGLLLTVMALGACSGPVTDLPSRLPPSPATLPEMRTFPATQVRAPSRSNARIAQDFLDLSFMMESGRKLPVMTRFEEPVTLRVVGDAPPSLEPDLAALLGRLRREARIDIRRVSAAETAGITIEVVSRARLQRLVPQAACFVAPRVTGWDEYRRARRTARVDWTTLTKREQVAIFLPGDVSPQEVRDCLHEELAQALGPLNDLYRLPDSVFNDDNFHTILTGFDMLVLRAYYAPELASGMTREQVARKLPSILARLNPRGQGRAVKSVAPTTRDWIEAVETALGPGVSAGRRRAAANRAVAIARAQGWNDTRLAFSLFALGRLTLAQDGKSALIAFLQAGEIYSKSSETRVQAAHVAMHLAAFSLSSGPEGAQTALRLVNGHLSAATEWQNAALLATMLLIKSEALDQLGRASEARAVRTEALGWARYGFGAEAEVRARMDEIAALRPANAG